MEICDTRLCNVEFLWLSAPINLVASSPSATQLTVTWTRPNDTVSSTNYVPDATASGWSGLILFCHNIMIEKIIKSCCKTCL